MTARQLYTELRRGLMQGGITASVEAAVLFELAAGQTYAGMDPDGDLAETVWADARALLARRLEGEPLQYLAGRWPFLDFELEVGPGALIPRPETETVAQVAIENLRIKSAVAQSTEEFSPQRHQALAFDPSHAWRQGVNQNLTALDLCAGSGCIAVAVARALPDCRVAAVERAPEAYKYLKRNAAALAPDVETIQADIFGFERTLADHAWDVIVSNPPYVTPQEYAENLDELHHEPAAAFLGGDDGLDFYRYIAAHYKNKLKPGGWLIFEIGAGQAGAVTALLESEDYCNIETRRDDFGQFRVVCARWGNKNIIERS